MAGDPYRIFREEDEYKRQSLQTIWPSLYDALAQLDVPRPTWGCSLSVHYDPIAGRIVEEKPVAGRLWLNGPPACVDCLASSCKRPGGYPLERVDNPRDWKP
jgi:hypothetical protein